MANRAETCCQRNRSGCSSKNELRQEGMRKLRKQIVVLGLCVGTILPRSGAAQTPAPAPATAQGPAKVQTQTAPQAQAPLAPKRGLRAADRSPVIVDGSEAMFTTMCALLASGFESNVSADHWTAFRAQMREHLRRQQGPAVDAVREFYRQHELRDPGATLSRYLWFGLVSGPAPKFQIGLRRDEIPPEVLALEGFSEILSDYYQEQKIGQLWKQVQPVYESEIERLHDPVSQVVFVTSAYLRQILDTTNPQTFTIVVEPLVGRITNVRNFGDHYALVLSGGEDIPVDVVRHAYLHFLLDGLPLLYPHVVAAKRPLYEKAAQAPRLDPDLKEDFTSYFAECTVRAVELKLKRISPGEKEAALTRDDEDGLVLVRPIFVALAKYESSEPSMKLYFPDLVRSIDSVAEAKRDAALTFAPAETAQTADKASGEVVSRSTKPAPTTVPNDAEVIAALTEGERRIAEKNLRAAETSFEKVLARYPDQPRAWYGIALVAYMDHDAARAKQVFGRLTTGEHAATQDPMVLAWSHIYLARIYDFEGNPEMEKAEYQSALAVEGGPDQAKEAAQKGLAAFAGEKPTARP
jgi:tetratricopeptide (TPR) repeat protein